MYSLVLKQSLGNFKINQINGVSQHARRLFATQPLGSEEYTKEPEYPKILDLSEKAIKRREVQAWHDEVKNVTTIEGKLIKVNMPKYYGFKCHMFREKEGHRYNCLPFYRQWTRTVFKDGMPANYFNTNVEEENLLLDAVREVIEEAVVFHRKGYRNNLQQVDDAADRERQLSLKICSDVNRFLLAALRPSTSHLGEIEMDIEPRHEAFWFAGGFDKSKAEDNSEKGKKDDTDPVDEAFQYNGNPLIALRNRAPLQFVHDFGHAEVAATEEVIQSRLNPTAVGYPFSYQHGCTIPGFWPGSQHQFGQLSYHDRGHMLTRNPAYGAIDNQEALHAQGIICSYAWLLGQACYQGFSTYNEITYPLITQTIITNGQLWSFYLYQLNTTTLNCHALDSNSRVNECWGTEELKLYEKIDENNKLVGFNDDVLRHLIRFYRNVPKERNVELRPYLGEEEQTVADIEDVKRREFLEQTFKHIMANKPRHRLEPEIYNWEKFYKIDNETMPMDARRRFFELDINPWNRRMDEHAPKYIPRGLRPGGPKSRIKFEKTYYP